jgi:flagellar secretion chaperone FliS
MAVSSPYSTYQETQLNTQTPGKLLVMTYDAAIRFTYAAAEGMKAGNLDMQNSNIRKAQNIILELISSLNMDQDKQLAANLYNLYTYMFDRLTQANIKDDPGALDETLGILSEMRATWAEAELSIRSGVPAARELVRNAA